MCTDAPTMLHLPEPHEHPQAETTCVMARAVRARELRDAPELGELRARIGKAAPELFALCEELIEAANLDDAVNAIEDLVHAVRGTVADEGE